MTEIYNLKICHLKHYPKILKSFIKRLIMINIILITYNYFVQPKIQTFEGELRWRHSEPELINE